MSERVCRCGHGYRTHYMPRDLSQGPGACSTLCDCESFADHPADEAQEDNRP